uniref:Uncharacterized protein n=1 Tax=Cacopsylla melanoneura TaxID=428564 RepID=A0A8D8ZCT0_9HEMI
MLIVGICLVISLVTWLSSVSVGAPMMITLGHFFPGSLALTPICVHTSCSFSILASSLVVNSMLIPASRISLILSIRTPTVDGLNVFITTSLVALLVPISSFLLSSGYISKCGLFLGTTGLFTPGTLTALA